MHDKMETVHTSAYGVARANFDRVTLKKGRYVIFPTTFEPDKKGKYVLRMYFSSSPDFKYVCVKKSLSKIIFLKTNFKIFINNLVIFYTLFKYSLIFALFVNLVLIFRELWYDEPPPPKCCSFLCKPPTTATQITIQSASDLKNPNPILGKCV